MPQPGKAGPMPQPGKADPMPQPGKAGRPRLRADTKPKRAQNPKEHKTQMNTKEHKTMKDKNKKYHDGAFEAFRGAAQETDKGGPLEGRGPEGRPSTTPPRHKLLEFGHVLALTSIAERLGLEEALVKIARGAGGDPFMARLVLPAASYLALDPGP
jgi:hypothetical protein